MDLIVENRLVIIRTVQSGDNTMSRRDREKEFKKKYIAEAAYRLFASSSYEAVTVEDIAREAEFGKGTLYQFFESKDDLLAYILEEGLDRICSEIASECSAAVDPREALNRLITLQYGFHKDFVHLFLAFKRNTDDLPNPDIAARVRLMLDRKAALSEQVLERGIRERVIIPADVQKLARATDCIVKGFVISGVEIDGAIDDPNKDLELIRMVLSNGILMNTGGDKSGGTADRQ